VLVTGCRSGFGLLIAQTLGRAGHTVYAGLRDLSTAGPLREACAGSDVRPVQLDVTSSEERDAVVHRIVDEHGRIDGLVNNAGIALAGFLELVDRDEFDKLMEVNVYGLWALTNAVLPAMRAQREGIVMNVTSMAGRVPNPGLGAYAASKFAVEGMTEALRHELRPHGVRVVLVEPGPFKTDIFKRNRWEARRMSGEHAYGEQFVKMEALVARAEAHMGDPQAVADLVLRLLSVRNPRLRWPIGPTTSLRLSLQRFAPWSLQEALFKRILGF
jgi:NAD(P)-dependent dehydrogenase (short-subunit alcohol dehydrogenase family)